MLLLGLAATIVQTPLVGGWAHFVRTSALDSRTVEIGTGEQATNDRRGYRLRLTKQSKDGAVQTRFAYSNDCSEARAVILSMRSLKMPAPAPYGERPLRPLIMDGPSYEFGAPSSYMLGSISITSGAGTPLSKWVDAALIKLDRCWK